MTENENDYFYSSDPDERMAMIEEGKIDPLVEIAEYHNGCHPVYSFCTPALKVVLHGIVEELEQLKNKGLALDKVYKWDDDYFGQSETTVFLEALAYNRGDVLDYLAHNGVVPSVKELREISSLYPEYLRSLAEGGVNINVVDEETGDTILHFLCCGLWVSDVFYEGETVEKFQDVMRYVIAHGADPNIRNKEGNTPLDCLKKDDLGYLVEGIL